MYHRIATAPPSSNVPGHYVPIPRFRAHMKALKRKGFQPVTIQQFVSGQVPAGKRAMVLTLDDGYEHWDTGALSILREMHWTATLFLVGGRIGGTNTWDNQHGDVVEALAGPEMVSRWITEGFEVGDHSYSHANLVDLDDHSLRGEIVESQSAILAAIGAKPKWFCYPYGAQDDRVREAVQQAGYSGACSTRTGLNDSETDPYRYRRINIRSDTWTPVLFWKLRREERRHQGVP